MVKTYYNDAIIGNSSMLGCLTHTGELVRLFWPNIDYPQHIEKMNVGVYFENHKNSTLWLNDTNFVHTQSYIPNTNILKTVCTDTKNGLNINQIDFAIPDKDILIRQYSIENISHNDVELGFVQYSAAVTSTPQLSSTLFDFGCDALIHYRHGYYISILSDAEVFQFQLGNNALDSAKYTELKGFDSIGMMNDGATSWKLGVFKPGETKQFNLIICASKTLKEIKELSRYSKTLNINDEYEKTEKYWIKYLNDARQVNTGKNEVDELYRRSLLVFKLMADKNTGGLLAAPEIDEGFTRCGRYAYCWGRDAAFITSALDKCGLNSAVDLFYKWTMDVQEEDGSWQQRYFMDGNLAPSWGLQIDETATLIHGMLKHYEVTTEIEFLNNSWESVKKGVEFLLGFMDQDTGLPKPSYDLWEERIGEHFYSSSAVYSGIMAGVKIGKILSCQEDLIKEWEHEGHKLKEAITRNFWREDRKCFLRGVRVKLNPWGSEYSDKTVIIKANPKDYYRDVTLEDGVVDISILGGAVPFEVYDIDDDKIKSSVETIEQRLTADLVGGIKRYENDNYIGGNPWVLTTLWVALYYAKAKEYKKAKAYLDWAVKSRTDLNLLPEQVDKDKGTPAWVIPLTWSHAMYVLVVLELIDADVF